MVKTREIILYIVLFSLLMIIYFLTLNSLSELLNISMLSLVSFSIPILTFSSIIASASVAIFVMKKNHEENVKIRKNERIDSLLLREAERKEQDRLTLMRSERILNDYIMISGGYSDNIKTTYDVQIITIDKLLIETKNLISDCRKIREYDYYYIEDRQIELFELTDTIIAISKNIEILLISEKLKVNPDIISDKFLEIKNKLEIFFKDSEFITEKTQS